MKLVSFITVLFFSFSGFATKSLANDTESNAVPLALPDFSGVHDSKQKTIIKVSTTCKTADGRMTSEKDLGYESCLKDATSPDRLKSGNSAESKQGVSFKFGE